LFKGAGKLTQLCLGPPISALLGGLFRAPVIFLNRATKEHP
jgi:hypothetical protein